MPTKKRKAKPKAAGNAATRQIEALRKTANDLRNRLEREVKARKIEARLRAGAKQAQDQLNAQLKSLREQGRKVASEFNSVVGRSRNLENARKEAQKMISRLRKELSERTAEVRHKSEELAKLAGRSAQRAAEIIRGEEHHHAHHTHPHHAPKQSSHAGPPAEAGGDISSSATFTHGSSGPLGHDEPEGHEH
ncbi:MAG TPA: hypothetical protein VMU16_08120 [Candidatus Binataceae bacterium]|nr:hypothetical protein [Candidatus Binataceae bacterium]